MHLRPPQHVPRLPACSLSQVPCKTSYRSRSILQVKALLHCKCLHWTLTLLPGRAGGYIVGVLTTSRARTKQLPVAPS